MNVMVIGANGKIGRLVVKNLIAKNHHVLAIINQHDQFIPNNSLVIKIKLKLNDYQQLERLIKESDAVISVVSSWKTVEKNSLTFVMNNLVPILNQYPNKRLISLTGSDSRIERDNFNLINFFFHPFLNLIAKKVLFDSENHLKILLNSNTNWTALRSPTMKNGQSDHYRLDNNHRPGIWHLVNREAVARALTDQIETDQYSQQAPFIF